MTRKMLFIVNAHAGTGKIKNWVLPIIDRFNAHGYTVEVHSTQRPCDATDIAARRGGRFDLLLCSGGDGTLNEVVSGLMRLEDKRPVIGYIPAGSTNDFSFNLYSDMEPLSVVEDILHGLPMPCDVGGLNDRYFIYCAAFGAFVPTTYETPQINKNILGRIAYFLEGTKHLNTLKAYPFTVKYGNMTIEDDFLYGMVTNSDSVAGIRGFGGHNVQLDDGLFEVLLIKMPKNLYELHLIITALIKLDFGPDLFYSFKTDALVFDSPEPIIWNVDGEFGGDLHTAVISNYRKAMTFVASSDEDADR